MFKDIMLGVMTLLVVTGIIIISMEPAEADRREAEFYRIGRAGACEVYRLEGSSVYVASSSYANYSCSVTR